MNRQIVAAGLALSLLASSGYGAAVPGNPEAGRALVTNSCAACHALYGTTAATDGAPPLSFLAKDNKANPRWVRGWLMDPHPPMPGIMLSRKQIDDVIAYLASLPTD
jgi:mono/diheme cytochrome c family protein